MMKLVLSIVILSSQMVTFQAMAQSSAPTARYNNKSGPCSAFFKACKGVAKADRLSCVKNAATQAGTSGEACHADINQWSQSAWAHRTPASN